MKKNIIYFLYIVALILIIFLMRGKLFMEENKTTTPTVDSSIGYMIEVPSISEDKYQGPLPAGTTPAQEYLFRKTGQEPK